MQPTLYFLRSSEQHIINDIFPYALNLDQLNISLDEFPGLAAYTQNYGFTSSDVGLYALVGYEVAGAVWIRQILTDNGEHIPVMIMGVKPKFQLLEIESIMLEQMLLEAGAQYTSIAVDFYDTLLSSEFYTRFGFETTDNDSKCIFFNKELKRMTKNLESKLVIRPSDGYDPRRWMD